MLGIVKLFLGMLIVIGGLLYMNGIIEWKEKDYICWPEKERIRWGDKVEVIAVGSLHVYAYPLSKTCDEDDRVYGGEIHRGYPTQY